MVRMRCAGLALGALVSAESLWGETLQRSAERIAAHALAGNRAYETLAYLSDKIGPRLSGSRGAELAVRWTAAEFRRHGIPVRTERVMVPRWVRGAERARLVSHNNQRVVLTALGGSPATPAEGITADVVAVRSFDELQELGRKGVGGKIVLYQASMDRSLVEAGEAFRAYAAAAEYRTKGPAEAAKLGAVASLVRSVDSASLRSPHTGAMREGEGRRIPAAAVAAEDAQLIGRLLARGERVRMHLVLTPRQLPDVESANVVAEIQGIEEPDKIVLIGAHLDSWDLGTGAIDNGSGVAMVMETMRLLRDLQIRTKRTIRCVLFMNEENGLRGAKAYAARHDPAKHFAALESDSGTGAPRGFRTTLSGQPLERVRALAGPVLERLGASEFHTTQNTGADTSVLVEKGVPGFGLAPDAREYFHYHHSAADTLDKIDRDHLAKNTAAVAVLTYILAEMD